MCCKDRHRHLLQTQRNLTAETSRLHQRKGILAQGRRLSFRLEAGLKQVGGVMLFESLRPAGKIRSKFCRQQAAAGALKVSFVALLVSSRSWGFIVQAGVVPPAGEC